MATVIAAQLVGAPAAQAATHRHALVVGHALKPGQQIVSADGKVRLVVRENGGVLEQRPHMTIWLARAAGSAKASRATRLSLHRNGVLAVSRGRTHTLWQHKLAGGHVTRLTLSTAGQVQLWRGTTRVAVRALPGAAVAQPPVQTPAPVPVPVSVPVPVADPAPSASAEPSPTATAEPTTDPAPAVTPLPITIPITLPIATPVATPAVSGYSLTTSYAGGGSTINIRSAPSTSASIPYTHPTGTAIEIVCQTVGTALGSGTYAGNRTWDRLGGADSGYYVHDVLTTTPGGAHATLADGGYTAYSAAIPRCDPAAPAPAPVPAATRESKAVAWAQGQIGATNWSGYCESFVHQAFGTGGTGYYSAEKDFQAQQAAGRLHPASDTNPPAGALVFYDYGGSSGFGHVSLSIGGGQTISTFGVEGSGKKVAQVPVTGRGLTYKGWAYASTTWPGR